MSRRRNEGEMTAGMVLPIFVLGGGLYLLFEKPVIFWLVYVPIMAIIIILVVQFFRNAKK